MFFFYFGCFLHVCFSFQTYVNFLFKVMFIQHDIVDVRSIFLRKGLSGKEAFDEIFCQWQGPGLVVVGNEGLVLCFLRHLVAFNHLRHCCKAKIRDLNSVLDSMQCITMSYWALSPGSWQKGDLTLLQRCTTNKEQISKAIRSTWHCSVLLNRHSVDWVEVFEDLPKSDS